MLTALAGKLLAEPDDAGATRLSVSDVSKLVNDDGTVTYLLCEVYQTPEGVADHIEQARGDALWDPFHDFLDKCEVIGGGPGTIVSSLW